MDLKEPGNLLLLVGMTRCELGGSIWSEAEQPAAGRVPRVDTAIARPLFAAVHTAIAGGLVRSCHDLSEGGLAVALAEMALAGGLGAQVSLGDVPHAADAAHDLVLLFSESPTRFVIEVRPLCLGEVLEIFQGLPVGRLGAVSAGATDGAANPPRLIVRGLAERVVIDAAVADMKAAWQRPLRWS